MQTCLVNMLENHINECMKRLVNRTTLMKTKELLLLSLIIASMINEQF